MNQKDWVEYFEAVNGRKPSMQEFQEAREKGEFVVEQKDASAQTSNNQAHSQEAAVAPTSFAQEQSYQKILQPVPGKRKPKLSFNKPTTFGLAVVAIVTAITLIWIFFFTGTKSLDGIWLSNTDSMPVVYELNGKKKKVNTTHQKKRSNEKKLKMNLFRNFLN